MRLSVLVDVNSSSRSQRSKLLMSVVIKNSTYLTATRMSSTEARRLFTWFGYPQAKQGRVTTMGSAQYCRGNGQRSASVGAVNGFTEWGFDADCSSGKMLQEEV